MTWPFANLQQFKYGAILVDPPWRMKMYSVKGMGRSPDGPMTRGEQRQNNPERHYATMALDDIKALPVAAIGHWKANHAPLMATPKIKLPPKPTPRQDFMTRSEAARFLWCARHTPHLARFFIIGWYTGSRRSVITGLCNPPRSAAYRGMTICEQPAGATTTAI